MRFIAWQQPNFRRYFVGQVVSSIGSWLQSLAVTWLVLEITGRGDRLGYAIALQFLPLLLFGAQAGVLADKVDNRRLLIATSAVSAALAVGFGVVVTTGRADLWVIYALTFGSGMILAVERPAMQAFVVQLVDADSLTSAVAMNSTIMSGARLIGPAVGGVLIATTGIASCFYVNAVSYVVVLAALVGIRRDQLLPRRQRAGAGGTIRDGLAYVRAHPEVRRPLLVMAVVGTIAINFGTTMPSMVRFTFGGSAGMVGAAMSLSAIGSIIGGVYVAGLELHPRRTLGFVLLGFAASMFLLAVSPSYWAFVLISLGVGFGSTSFQSVDTVVLQRATEPEMQGRVMALHQMALFGSTPIGALLMGWIIEATSPRIPFVIGGLAALGCAAALLVTRRQPEPRPLRPDIQPLGVAESG
jgi:MFS family permease